MSRALPAAGLSAGLKRYFKLGTVGRRRWYERTKRWMNHRTFAARRREAEALRGQADYVIPADHGFAGFLPEQFGEIPSIVDGARRRLSQMDLVRRRQPRVTTTGVYVHLLDRRELGLDSPFLRFVLRRDVVAAVSEYLGAVPVLAQIDLWHSESVAEWNNSHFFHCDWSALSQIKIFLYCSDVGPGNGPLTMVEAATSRDILRRLKYNYQRDGDRYRVSDERMKELGGRPQALTGPAGSAFFADTSRCFHFGSRVEPGAAPRWLALYQLVLPSAFQLPLNFQYGAPFRRLAHPGLPRYQRLVLGAE